jgi:peptide/nickel transport system substrate-binding protein
MRYFKISAAYGVISLAAGLLLSTGVAVGQEQSTIRIAIPLEHPSLGSYWGYSAKEGLVHRQVHEPLVDRDPVTNELVPGLALSWEQVEPTIWEFELREGVKFHDGSAFNAEAAAFGINWTYDPEKAYVVQTLLPDQEYRAEPVDEYTLRVHTGIPDPIYPARAFAVGIPSMVQIQERLETYETTPIGTGAYRFVEWDRGSSYTLERNPDWWGIGDESQNQPGYDRAVFVIRPEVASRIAAHQAGEVDFAWDLIAGECKTALGDECTPAITSETLYVRFDVTHKVMSDPRIREAMALALDRKLIGDELMGGSPPAASLVIPGVTGAPDIEPWPYDPERAAQLVEEARADGVPVDDFPMLISARQGAFPGNEEMMEVVHAMFVAVGLKANMEYMEELAFREIFDLPDSAKPIPDTRGWVNVHGHGNDEFDYARTYAANHMCTGPSSTGCNEELDKEFVAASQLTGQERQEALAKVAEQMYNMPENLMFIPLVHQIMFHGVDSKLDWAPRADMQLLLKDIKPAE